jgi:hypothetical protein
MQGANYAQNDEGPYTRIKTRKLLQIFKQVVTRLLSSRYQDVFALLVASCCNKSEASCYHLVFVTSCCGLIVCHQLVNNLLRADNIRLIVTTCCEFVGSVNLVTNKMITTCSRLVNNWEQAVRTHLVETWFYRVLKITKVL